MVESAENADASGEYTAPDNYYHYTSWWCSKCNAYHDANYPCPYENQIDYMPLIDSKLNEIIELLREIKKKVKS